MKKEFILENVIDQWLDKPSVGTCYEKEYFSYRQYNYEKKVVSAEVERYIIKLILNGEVKVIKVEGWPTFRQMSVGNKESFWENNDLVKVKQKMNLAMKTRLEKWLWNKVSLFKLEVKKCDI